MAARYWIGGTGNWSDTAHWSATSGGVGGASVPTMNDDVYFDSNSGAGTITVNTIANMRDCTFAQTQLITLANAAYSFNIYGNWTLCSDTYLNTSFTGTGYVYLKATTSVNITSNGCTRAWNRLNFDGVGGTWTNQDNINLGFTKIILSNGTWDTNDKTITSISNFDTGVGIKTLNLKSSLFIIASFYNTYPSGYTFNYGTSTVKLGTSPEITGNNTFYNLENTITYINGRTMMLYGNQTITNNLNIYCSESRLLITSNIIGTPRKITCNGTVTASNVDFRDIVGAGTANWDLSAIAGGSGDCGGNSGITFTPAQTQYFKHTSGAVNWSDATKWFSNYERTIQGRVPLPQDDAIFDENSFIGTSTLDVNVSRIGGLNMNPSFNVFLSQSVEIYGSLFLNNNTIAITYNQIALRFRKDIYIDTNNFEFDIIQCYGFSSACYNLSALRTKSFFTLYSGDFHYGDNDASHNFIYHPGGNLYLGSKSITLNRTADYLILTVAGFIYGESSTIKVNTSPIGTLPYISSNRGQFNHILFKNNPNSGCRFTLGVNVVNMTIEPNNKIFFEKNQVSNISKLTAIGTPEQPITIGSTTAGQRHTINYTGSEASTVEYCNISDIKVTQARRLLAKNSVNAGNNQNWGFDELPPLALNFGQVDKMYVGGTEVVSAYYGEMKIK